MYNIEHLRAVLIVQTTVKLHLSKHVERQDSWYHSIFLSFLAFNDYNNKDNLCGFVFPNGKFKRTIEIEYKFVCINGVQINGVLS